MISFVYQIQRASHGKWSPVCEYRSGKPLEFTSLEVAHEQFLFLSSQYDNVRLVKIETYLIN